MGNHTVALENSFSMIEIDEARSGDEAMRNSSPGDSGTGIDRDFSLYVSYFFG
jgi:hypothetical protein